MLASVRLVEGHVDLWVPVRALNDRACVFALQYWQIIRERAQLDLADNDSEEDTQLKYVQDKRYKGELSFKHRGKHVEDRG